jgi:hypothetical protein
VQHFLHVRLLLRSAEPLDLDDRLGRGLLEHVLAIQRGHALVLGVGLLLCVFDGRSTLRVRASAELLLAGVLGDAEVVEVGLLARRDRNRVEDQVVGCRRELDLLATGEDLVAAVLLVPLCEGGRQNEISPSCVA